jgi:hypothetical protein
VTSSAALTVQPLPSMGAEDVVVSAVDGEPAQPSVAVHDLA